MEKVEENINYDLIEETKIFDKSEKNHVLVKNYSFYTELLLVNSDEPNYKYSKMIFFACGLNEASSDYITKFANLLLDKNLFNVKLMLFNTKEYIKDNSFKSLLDNEKPNKVNDKDTIIRSYFRAEFCEENKKNKIIFDAELDLKAINLLNKELKTLEYNWKNIMLAGVSIGGRYCIHLVELLNADVFVVNFYQTDMTDYKRDQSSFLYFYYIHHFFGNKNDYKHNFVKNFYNYKFNEIDDAVKVDKKLAELYRTYTDRCWIFATEKVEKNVISRVPKNARYSNENDNLNSEVLENSINSLKNQYKVLKISNEKDVVKKNNYDSVINLIDETIEDFRNSNNFCFY